MITIRRLTAADQEIYEAYLTPKASSSIFLLANSREAGFEDHGERPQGTYFGAFDGAELAGVAALFWNGNLTLQAPPDLVPGLVQAIQAAELRPIHGFVGPAAQVAVGLETLGRPAEHIQCDEPEGLYLLALDKLRVPEALTTGRLVGRQLIDADLELLSEWEARYRVETLGFEYTADLVEKMRTIRRRDIADGGTWVVTKNKTPVATSRFNATLPEVVQIGGVWTPPPLRGRGYARAAVAASLVDARERGVSQSVLFTGLENLPAVKAYEALGYERIGDYRIVLFVGYGK